MKWNGACKLIEYATNSTELRIPREQLDVDIAFAEKDNKVAKTI